MIEGKYLPIIRGGRTFPGQPHKRGVLATADAFTRRAVYGFTVDRVLLDKIKRMDTMQRRKTAERFLGNFMEENKVDFAPYQESFIRDVFIYRLQRTSLIDFGFCDYARLSLVKKRSPLADKTFTIDVDMRCVASGKPIMTICTGERTDRCVHIMLQKIHIPLQPQNAISGKRSAPFRLVPRS